MLSSLIPLLLNYSLNLRPYFRIRLFLRMVFRSEIEIYFFSDLQKYERYGNHVEIIIVFGNEGSLHSIKVVGALLLIKMLWKSYGNFTSKCFYPYSIEITELLLLVKKKKWKNAPWQEKDIWAPIKMRFL